MDWHCAVFLRNSQPGWHLKFNIQPHWRPEYLQTYWIIPLYRYYPLSHSRALQSTPTASTNPFHWGFIARSHTGVAQNAYDGSALSWYQGTCSRRVGFKPWTMEHVDSCVGHTMTSLWRGWWWNVNASPRPPWLSWPCSKCVTTLKRGKVLRKSNGCICQWPWRYNTWTESYCCFLRCV